MFGMDSEVGVYLCEVMKEGLENSTKHASCHCSVSWGFSLSVGVYVNYPAEKGLRSS